MNTINLYFSLIQIAYGFLQAFRAVYSFGLYRLHSYTILPLCTHTTAVSDGRLEIISEDVVI